MYSQSPQEKYRWSSYQTTWNDYTATEPPPRCAEMDNAWEAGKHELFDEVVSLKAILIDLSFNNQICSTSRGA